MVPIHHNHKCLDLLADCNKSMVTIAIMLVAAVFIRQQAIKIKLVAAPCTTLTFVTMSQCQQHIALVPVESFKNMTFPFASVSWCFMHNYSFFTAEHHHDANITRLTFRLLESSALLIWVAMAMPEQMNCASICHCKSKQILLHYETYMCLMDCYGTSQTIPPFCHH